MTDNLKIQTAYGKELTTPDLGRFYKRNGHKGRIQPDDLCMWLSTEDEILAAARLSTIAGLSAEEARLLRGMWVAKQYRGQTLGRQLLNGIIEQLNGQANLYCLAYPEVTQFYQQHGFSDDQETPPKALVDKQRSYAKRGTPTVLLVYAGVATSERSHSI